MSNIAKNSAGISGRRHASSQTGVSHSPTVPVPHWLGARSKSGLPRGRHLLGEDPRRAWKQHGVTPPFRRSPNLRHSSCDFEWSSHLPMCGVSLAMHSLLTPGRTTTLSRPTVFTSTRFFEHDTWQSQSSPARHWQPDDGTSQRPCGLTGYLPHLGACGFSMQKGGLPKSPCSVHSRGPNLPPPAKMTSPLGLPPQETEHVSPGIFSSQPSAATSGERKLLTHIFLHCGAPSNIAA
mmetsp:Transcript_103628/g.299751  ORF Transcript_103628/g.299751 Transcript_103628/m.299751 type:complete len:236 (-) Transcript_103628:526-1233(-)